jgi:hypothetical protein
LRFFPVISLIIRETTMPIGAINHALGARAVFFYFVDVADCRLPPDG